MPFLCQSQAIKLSCGRTFSPFFWCEQFSKLPMTLLTHDRLLPVLLMSDRELVFTNILTAMTSATARNASYANERRIAPFPSAQGSLGRKQFVRPCHSLFLPKASPASRLLWKSLPVHFHKLANILHFPHLTQVLLVKVT